ncbi:alpha/beta fold hydrolase, partial [Schaalia naturae]|uniref:alpha/beta fold hydrolase n=1 Tax=Schaalia naturae TaxID=635203 RepID=UPI00362F26E1
LVEIEVGGGGPRRLAARLRAGACPDVQVVRVPGARHMSAVEQPERIARALLARTGAGPLS